MRIAIDAPPVRSLSANEKMVYQFLKEGLTPIEIARRMKLPVGRNNFSDNRYDVPNETITRLITSIREKGWDIPTNNKEEAEMQKLTEENKRSIVTANQAGATAKELAEKYGVAKGTIWNIVSEWKKRGETALSGETEVETKEEPALGGNRDTGRREHFSVIITHFGGFVKMIIKNCRKCGRKAIYRSLGLCYCVSCYRRIYGETRD